MTVIYALVAASAPTRIRYVGKAADPDQRLRKHLAAAGRPQTHVQQWIASRLRAGDVIEYQILETCGIDWALAERGWIQLLRDLGHDLCNLTLGGDGGTAGYRQSPETRAKISAATRGRSHAPEHVAKVAAALRGRVIDNAWRAKLAAATKGRVKSPEHQNRISIALRGLRRTPESRANMARAQRLRFAKGKK